ncbi:hypothetical protein AB836_00695 [Rickettsiales bacterium (ex Bugula neritina AB1)]|nr:hypothetical protein AB836_00695 [Rickettsiales bacterium (ex Bugula neritina AB1)]
MKKNTLFNILIYICIYYKNISCSNNIPIPPHKKTVKNSRVILKTNEDEKVIEDMIGNLSYSLLNYLLDIEKLKENFFRILSSKNTEIEKLNNEIENLLKIKERIYVQYPGCKQIEIERNIEGQINNKNKTINYLREEISCQTNIMEKEKESFYKKIEEIEKDKNKLEVCYSTAKENKEQKLQKTLNKKEEELNQKEEEIKQLKKILKQKEKEIKQREEESKQQEKESNQRKEEIKELQKTLNKREEKLNAREEKLNAREEESKQQEKESNQRKEEIKELQKTLNKREEKLNAREEELKQQEKESNQRKEERKELQKKLNEREEKLNAREEESKQQEKESNQRKEENKEQELQKEIKQLNAREENIEYQKILKNLQYIGLIISIIYLIIELYNNQEVYKILSTQKLHLLFNNIEYIIYSNFFTIFKEIFITIIATIAISCTLFYMYKNNKKDNSINTINNNKENNIQNRYIGAYIMFVSFVAFLLL